MSAACIDVVFLGLTCLAPPFTCAPVLNSDVVAQVCYEPARRVMVIWLGEPAYAYCDVPQAKVDGLLAAPSKGVFYVAEFRSRGAAHGPYDCRDHPLQPG